MDGGAVRDLLSLQHIYTTFREILFEPEVFAEKIRTGGFLEITRPLPFITACLFVLAFIAKARGRASPLSLLSTATQLEIILFFFLPFASVFHWGMKSDNQMSSTKFGASVCGWLYVFGMLALVFALFVAVGPYLSFLRQFPSFTLLVLITPVLVFTVLVMAPLYEAFIFDDMKNTLIVATLAGGAAFFGGRELYEQFGFNPSAWLADAIDGLLH